MRTVCSIWYMMYLPPEAKDSWINSNCFSEEKWIYNESKLQNELALLLMKCWEFISQFCMYLVLSMLASVNLIWWNIIIPFLCGYQMHIILSKPNLTHGWLQQKKMIFQFNSNKNGIWPNRFVADGNRNCHEIPH